MASALAFANALLLPWRATISFSHLTCSLGATVAASVMAGHAAPMSSYVDVHCHLVHRRFENEEDDVALRAKEKGLEFCVVNGLNPESNRGVLDLCSRHAHLLPALGIYPLDACTNVIDETKVPEDFHVPPKFDVDAEVRFIEEKAAAKEIVAIGEVGMDRHYLTDDVCLDEQERVLRLLIQVAKRHDLPLILHTRKAEQRVFNLLVEEGVVKADFHCYCGKIKLAKQIAKAGYYISIPSAVERIDSFQQLARAIPLENILTETDSPYMSPDKDTRNEPATVPRGVAAIALARQESVEHVQHQIRANFRALFGK